MCSEFGFPLITCVRIKCTFTLIIGKLVTIRDANACHIGETLDIIGLSPWCTNSDEVDTQRALLETSMLPKLRES